MRQPLSAHTAKQTARHSLIAHPRAGAEVPTKPMGAGGRGSA